MDSLKLTFTNGTSTEIPFSVESSLQVETPDGVNGVQRGAWGEIARVEYVDGAAATNPFLSGDAAVAGSIEDVDPNTADVPPDPSTADAASDGATGSADPATGDGSASSDATSTSDATPTDPPAA